LAFQSNKSLKRRKIIMNNQERFRYQMFIRLRQFGTENAADFPAGGVGATQFAEISTVIGLIEGLAANQSAGFGSARFAFASKDTARENLRETMSEISRTARAMVYQFPGIDAKFRLPRNKTDTNLLAAARAFESESEVYKEDFIAYGLAADFREELRNEADALEASLRMAGAALNGQVAATAEIGAVIRRGMIAQRILKGVVKNKYRADVGKLAAWLSASHIEKAPKRTATVIPTT
jgi:hypothetical protein